VITTASVLAELTSRPVWLALLLALTTRVVWFGVAQTGVPFQRPKPSYYQSTDEQGRHYTHTPIQAIDMWTRWDGYFYLKIARDGYPNPPAHLTVAFFPLYPLLVAATAAATGLGVVGSGLLVANLADLAGWLLLALLAAHRLGKSSAALCVLMFALFPTRNFGFSTYTEGLFLALSVAAFLAYETRRFGVAALAGALCSAVRPQGALLGAALWIDAALARAQKRDDAPGLPDLAALSLAPAGLVAYTSYLAATFGNPLYFMEVQKVWKRSLTTPFHTLLAGGADPHVYALVALSVGFVVLMIRKKEPLRDWLYVALSLAVPLTSGSLQSFARFVGVLFPLFIFAAKSFPPRSRPVRVYLALAAIYSLVFAFKVGQNAGVT
jgi:Gpi18-like mannosyltransferase